MVNFPFTFCRRRYTPSETNQLRWFLDETAISSLTSFEIWVQALLSRSTFQRFNLVCWQFYAIESSFLAIFWVRSCFLAIFWTQDLDKAANQLCRRDEILFQCRKSSFIFFNGSRSEQLMRIVKSSKIDEKFWRW